VKLSRINSFLVVTIVVINLYTVLTPLMPAILFWFDSKVAEKSEALSSKLHVPASSAANTPYAKENRLVVPTMLLDEPILEGRDASVLNKGIWRRPNTSTPDQGGNTVIVGHRFTYKNPRGTFYNLHHPKVGDEIGVFWNGKRYLYAITQTKVVPASEISVEAPSDKPLLTLYSCTPLWMPKDRLVVVAQLQEEAAL
jgi:LPXTG-site transpeptidase (sortase) family protein